MAYNAYEPHNAACGASKSSHARAALVALFLASLTLMWATVALRARAIDSET